MSGKEAVVVGKKILILDENEASRKAFANLLFKA
jgi:hypothetical protein